MKPPPGVGVGLFVFLAGEQLQLAARVGQLRARGRGLGQRGGLALGAHL